MRFTRRRFCAGVGAAAITWLDRPRLVADEPPVTFRVIAYNVYACKGWPEDRAAAKAAVSEGQIAKRLASGLARYKPDLVNFSESPTEAIAREIADLLGMHHVRFPSAGNWPGTLLSRYEITESQNVPLVDGERPADLFTRHWGRATIGLPGGETVIVHSAHLYPKPDPAVRLREIPAMLKAMRPDLEAGRSMLLMGDLNHVPDSREYRLWLDAGWVDTFAVSGKEPGYTIKADQPARRIDYVMAAGPLAKRITESRPLFEGAFRLDVDDPEAYALSDHLPQLATFSSKP